MSKLFKLDENRNILCECINTRYGFKHKATLFEGEYETDISAKCCYYNRTWERFQYEMVLIALLNKVKDLTKEQRVDFIYKHVC